MGIGDSVKKDRRCGFGELGYLVIGNGFKPIKAPIQSSDDGARRGGSAHGTKLTLINPCLNDVTQGFKHGDIGLFYRSSFLGL